MADSTPLQRSLASPPAQLAREPGPHTENVSERWERSASSESPVDHDEGVTYGFPGCRPIRISRDEITDFEGHFEYWDADTEIAWMAHEPTSVYHELPGQRLARLTERIAAVRGAPIESYGTGDLLVRDASGEKHRVIQADQILYLHPNEVRPLGHAVEVGHDDLPDVVLEVDLTTDVRPRKMGIYQDWGFPELWVEVPENRAPSRPNRKPGFTIRVLGAEGYVEVPVSRAFPTWTAREIHAAMNESALTAATTEVLRRVGRTLGERGGTSSDDDPLLHVEREEGRRGARFEMLLEALAARNIATSAKLEAESERIAGVPVRTLMRAAMACRDEADFLQRIEVSP